MVSYTREYCQTNLKDQTISSIHLDLSFNQKLLIEVSKALSENNKAETNINCVGIKGIQCAKPWAQFVSDYKQQLVEICKDAEITIKIIKSELRWSIVFKKTPYLQDELIINGKVIAGEPIWWLRYQYSTILGPSFEYIEQTVFSKDAKTNWDALIGRPHEIHAK